MGDDDRVIVHVDNSHVGVDLARDLMHRTLRGQPHADLQELGDAGFGGQEPDHPAQEAPVLHRCPAQPGHQREHLLRGDPVRLEVALAAQVVVIHPRHVRRRHVQAQRGSLRPGHITSVSTCLPASSIAGAFHRPYTARVSVCHAIEGLTDRARASRNAAAAVALANQLL